MKKLLFILLLLTGPVSQAFSQAIDDKSKEDLINIAENNGFTGQLEQDLLNLKNGPGQAAVIKQTGNNNEAFIAQSGSNQFAYILQDGDWLDAVLTMNGKNNNAIIKQKGYHLLTEVKLTGSNNDFKLLQAGTHFSNNMILQNVTGMDILFLQTESQFLYSQSGGNGISLQIQTEQAVPTIIVTNN